MEKKTNTEIAENVSSGAEKVERIEKEKSTSASGEKSVKTHQIAKKTGAGTKRTKNKTVKSVE